MDLQQFFHQDFTYAVIGATGNVEKYGYKVFHDLCLAGWRAIPVNPKRPNILGVTAVATLSEIHPPANVAVFVVPPAVGLKVMDEAAALGLKKLWFQPGAESPEIIDRAKELELEAVADGSCIMVERRRLGFTESNHDCQAKK